MCYSGQNNAIIHCDFTDSGLKEESKIMIDNALWYLGGTTESYQENNNSSTSNFYVYEQAGQGAGVYILTTDEEEANQGTYYTPGEEGQLNRVSGNQDFKPNDLCTGEDCNISLAKFCNDGKVARTFKFIGLMFFVAKILVPAIIIIVGIVDLVKVITSGKEEEMKKHVKNLGVRVIIGVLIFLLPSIINAIYGVASDLVSDGGTSAFDNCEACLMTPNSSACYVEENEDQ